ncbi:predicted protein [Coccidioides posadasii str. Silveira]|uniref:Predicted protein n=2 Tax=Coccidioides posadasii TaxID=199306 RepID=E9DEL7_COCPS|nr:predicted protein [Coccidioides posadasii str. Silveira]KMM68849.1 hypothetical protein CPAG_05173 [Coccidioides posadasii RMSCC 3488]
MDIVVGLATITTNQDSRVIAGTEIIVRVHQSDHTTRPAARPHSKGQSREHRKFFRDVRSSCHRCFDHHTQPHTQAQIQFLGVLARSDADQRKKKKRYSRPLAMLQRRKPPLNSQMPSIFSKRGFWSSRAHRVVITSIGAKIRDFYPQLTSYAA